MKFMNFELIVIVINNFNMTQKPETHMHLEMCTFQMKSNSKSTQGEDPEDIDKKNKNRII